MIKREDGVTTGTPKNKQHKVRKRNVGLKVLLALLVMLILCVLGYIGWLLYGYYSANAEYDMVREGFVEPAPEPEDADDGDDTEPEYVSPFPDRDIDIAGLLEQNPDFLCWLYYPDGVVDYPVVKERKEDVNGYLHRTFEGKTSSSGCVFMGWDADSGFHDMNTFLFGHNMRDGKMFGSLKYLYRDPQENFKDPYFYVWTKDYERIMYRVVAMYVVDKDSEMFAVPMTAAGYVEYKDKMMAMGSVDGFVKITDEEMDKLGHGSPLVTLQACYGPAGTRNRLLITGVEILREDFE